MLRVLIALAILASAASPAAARQPDPSIPWVVPGRAENWVEIGQSPKGDRGWYESNVVLIDGAYRTARVRIQFASTPEIFESWIRFDCTSLVYQSVEGENVAAPTEVGPRMAYEPDAAIFGLRNALCARNR